MKKSHDKISTRLALILTKFNNGERFTQEELAQEFGVSERTIHRDIKRLSYLPIKKENTYYCLETYALGKLSFDDIKNFATISGIKSFYPELSNSFITDILNTKINSVYLVKNQGFEKLEEKTKEFKCLSASILNNEQIHCLYNDKKRILNPYKLVNNNGIWYLVADENGKLKTYTYSKIKKLKVLESKFTPNSEFIKIIDKDEVNWFSQDELMVTLEIDKTISEYFLRRNILSNQKILEETEDKLILSTKVSYEDEILSIVKYGLPYIKIISPNHLQKKLENMLTQYLKLT